MARKLKIKVVVHVSGGNVQGVYTNCPLAIRGVLVDEDNMKAAGIRERGRDKILMRAVEGMSNLRLENAT